MKVYIAGAITDNPNYREQFKEAEERLVAAGHAVINPCKNEGFTYREYINMGLCELMHCDAIYLLEGYETSTGATLEHDYARTVGLEVMSEAAEKASKQLSKLNEALKRASESMKRIVPAAAVRGVSEYDSLIKCLEFIESVGGEAKLDAKRIKQILILAEKAKPRDVISAYGATLCPHCGSDVGEDDEYCSTCGQHLC